MDISRYSCSGLRLVCTPRAASRSGNLAGSPAVTDSRETSSQPMRGCGSPTPTHLAVLAHRPVHTWLLTSDSGTTSRRQLQSPCSKANTEGQKESPTRATGDRASDSPLAGGSKLPIDRTLEEASSGSYAALAQLPTTARATLQLVPPTSDTGTPVALSPPLTSLQNPGARLGQPASTPPKGRRSIEVGALLSRAPLLMPLLCRRPHPTSTTTPDRTNLERPARLSVAMTRSTLAAR